MFHKGAEVSVQSDSRILSEGHTGPLVYLGLVLLSLALSLVHCPPQVVVPRIWRHADRTSTSRTPSPDSADRSPDKADFGSTGPLGSVPLRSLRLTFGLLLVLHFP